MTKVALNRFLKEFPDALNDGVGAVFVGAGVSMGAGYPSWSELLHEIGDELGVGSRDNQDLAALAQWSIQESGSSTRVRNVIKREIGVDKAVPESLKVVARLPVRHIWTTNYDELIERAFKEIQRPIDSISGAKDLALRSTPGATRLYKMHGSVARLDDIVISTDDYELYRSTRGSYLPLLQAHLTSMSMLFIGLSFTDPNVRHVLSLIRESFTEAPPEHFAIVRPPKRENSGSDEEFKVRTAQHNLWARDLKRYGLLAVEIDDYDEVPALLRTVERRVAERRVWVSGSWPLEAAGAERIYVLSEAIGREVGRAGLDLVTGAGLTVGSASISGFLDALRSGGGWDLDRRLIARPFPQALHQGPKAEDWTSLRKEMARQAGIVVVVGGAKHQDGHVVDAIGVQEEVSIAQAAGALVIPIGATGGVAKKVSDSLVGSQLPCHGVETVRPTDDELQRLANPSASNATVVDLIFKIINRVRKGG